MVSTPRSVSKAGTPEPADPNKPVAMSFRVHPDVQKAIRHAAIDEGVLVQDIIRRAIIEYLGNHKIGPDLHKYY